MNITIKNPCEQNWDAMIPNNTGAFCLSCQKNVIDFSQKSLEQIKEYFCQKSDSEKVCARFKESQLQAFSFDEFYKDYIHWKPFQKSALIVFFVFGSSLFGHAQTPKNNAATKTVSVSTIQSDSTKILPKKDKKETPLMGNVKYIPEAPKKVTERTTMGEPEMIWREKK